MHKAQYWYGRALKENPWKDDLLVLQGRSYDLVGRFPEAFLRYQEARRRQPYNGYFDYRLGEHYWRRGFKKKAHETFLLGKKKPHGAKWNECGRVDFAFFFS